MGKRQGYAMQWFFIRVAIIAMSLAVAAAVIDGVDVDTRGTASLGVFLLTAVILALTNMVVRPILVLFSLPAIILTLGFFLIIINALMLWLASWIAGDLLGLDFHVRGFWPALGGALIISVVSWVLTGILVGSREEGRAEAGR